MTRRRSGLVRRRRALIVDRRVIRRYKLTRGQLMEFVEDPVLRQRYRFDRDGDLLRVEVWADPGARVPLHVHPALEERWEGVDGDVTFRIDGERRQGRAGPPVGAAPGVRHACENTGARVAHLRVEGEPALELEEFLVEGAALNRSGRFTARGIPKGVRAAADAARFIERYRGTTVL